VLGQLDGDGAGMLGDPASDVDQVSAAGTSCGGRGRGTTFSLGRDSYLYPTGYIPALDYYPQGHVPTSLLC
jgi:hypothetical protein